MSFKNMVLSKVGRQLLTVQKHSPKILFVAGVAGVVGTVVLASRATLKVEQVLETHDENMKKVELALITDPEVYQESNAQQDRVITYTKTIISLARLYGPAILVGTASVAALTGSHVILNNRVSSLTAAYAVLDRGFREYRRRVVDELGQQKDAEFRYGAEDHEVIRETETGPVVETIKRAPHGRSIYARWFDEGSTNWQRNPMHNQMFIRSQQDWANDMLRAHGYLFLNDVYKMLGLELTPEGQLVGWVLDNERGGDNYVDFGVFSNDFFIAERFVNGDERNILLDFNVDGQVYDLIGKKKR
jgi:Family of unknown function (DUF6353)